MPLCRSKLYQMLGSVAAVLLAVGPAEAGFELNTSEISIQLEDSQGRRLVKVPLLHEITYDQYRLNASNDVLPFPGWVRQADQYPAGITGSAGRVVIAPEQFRSSSPLRKNARWRLRFGWYVHCPGRYSTFLTFITDCSDLELDEQGQGNVPDGPLTCQALDHSFDDILRLYGRYLSEDRRCQEVERLPESAPEPQAE